MRIPRLFVPTALVAALVLAACGGQTDADEPDTADSSTDAADDGTDQDATDADASAESTADGADASDEVTVEHAFGTTTIPEAPERIATVNWANHEVPLALGVVPVGMAEANFGDDGSGVLPWVSERLDELDADMPVLFDENDGIDFEAVADTDPDVILAAYSGLTEEDYNTLSEIAPVVAYPEGPWATDWRDVITYNSAGMGMADEGEALIADIEDEIADTLADYPDLAGTSAMFLTHVDPTDLSEVNFYTANDTRAAFFEDLGLATPASIEEASGDPDQFSGTISAEQVDTFADVELIVTYGDEDLVATLEGDPLLSQMPAVANGAIVRLGDGPVGTAANPTPLAIEYVLDEYVELLAEAASNS